MVTDPAASVLTGQRLGVYHLQERIGAGGMGEVYRARDTKLGRDVAIKILPRMFTAEPDRLARFEREARVLAALNHPNIATIHGIEDSEGVRALVMELVEGPTLAERVARGAIPVPEAVAVARQVVDALEAAHEKGIVHRDLKPANIKVTPTGTVKVLDFGIAKVVEGGGGAGVSHLPTLTVGATRSGSIVGTPAYMSPEQARGQTVDKRTDIWAFGCVLYEMLTGCQAFCGKTVPDTFVAVLEREPDWNTLPAHTPAPLRVLLRRCLAKDPKQRLRDIGDAALDLAADDGGAESSMRWSRRAVIAAAAGLSAVIVGSIALGYFLGANPTSRSEAALIRFSVPAPEGATFARSFSTTFLALSPDGSQLAFVASTPQGPNRIWLRAMSSLEVRPLSGTEGAAAPAWSPDGRSLAFWADGKLMRVDLTGDAPVPLCDAGVPGDPVAATWGSRGTILFARGHGSAIFSVSASGGTPEAIVTFDPSRGETEVSWPWYLPDGQRFLYLTRYSDGTGQVMLGQRGRSARPILQALSNVQWVDPEYLVFARDGVLVGQRFDVATEQVVGEPFTIAAPVDYFRTTSRTAFAASRSGAIAYHGHADEARLVWTDRAGNQLTTVGTPGDYQGVRISPNGGSVVFDRTQPGVGTYDVWTLDLARDVETRLTTDPGTEAYPVWEPDERGIVFATDQGGYPPHLFRLNLETGTYNELLPGGTQQWSKDVSPDGKTLLFLERTRLGNFDIWTLALDRPSAPSPLLVSRFNKPDVRLSPDGHAIAFMSNESGRSEVYVAAFPAVAAKVRISVGGGRSARWRRDGRELFYISPDHRIMEVSIRTTPSLEVGKPVALFSIPQGSAWNDYDVARDGLRFLAVVPQVLGGGQPVSVVLNWKADGR